MDCPHLKLMPTQVFFYRFKPDINPFKPHPS